MARRLLPIGLGVLTMIAVAWSPLILGLIRRKDGWMLGYIVSGIGVATAVFPVFLTWVKWDGVDTRVKWVEPGSGELG